jgi:hypothetical protein
MVEDDSDDDGSVNYLVRSGRENETTAKIEI